MKISRGRHLIAIMLLPVVVLVIIPLLILNLTDSLNLDWSQRGVFPILLGLLLIAIGLILVIATINLFIKHGGGTLAPWDPTQRLVIQGIYRHVRNPAFRGIFGALW